jgi:hypothetical protein
VDRQERNSEGKEEDEAYEELDQIPDYERTLITQHFDFIVRSLADQIEDRTLVLKDKYERQFIWPKKKSSRLIESLLMNVPIPVLYFAETGRGNYSVIDGHQRLFSIYQFLNNKYKLIGLRVLDQLNGKRFKDLSEDERNTIKSRTIRCIVISKKSDPLIRFDVFERLNTGSSPLRAQELRNCIFSGRLNDLLHQLARDEQFLSLLNKAKPDKRMTGEGLILRFLALHNNLPGYRGDVERFLDKFQEDNADPDDLNPFELQFNSTVRLVKEVFGRQAFRRYDPEKNDWIKNVNSAIYDSMMLCFARSKPEQLLANKDALAEGFKELCSNEEFRWAVGEAPVHRPRVRKRLEMFRQMMIEKGVDVEDFTWWPEAPQ